MCAKEEFLEKKVQRRDVLLIEVMASLGEQKLRAKVARIYSAQHGVPKDSLGKYIEFIRSPGTWGEAILEVGDRALLFVSHVSNKLYEDAWRGHMLVEPIDGVMFAIYQFRELWLCKDASKEIRDASRQDPARPYATAIRFDVMERYLMRLIDRNSIINNSVD